MRYRKGNKHGKISEAIISSTCFWPTWPASPILSQADKTQPTVPSPPHIKTRKLGTFLNMVKPGVGPPLAKSKTWAGFRFCRRRFKKRGPRLFPLLELTNATIGHRSGLASSSYSQTQRTRHTTTAKQKYVKQAPSFIEKRHVPENMKIMVS